MPAPRCAAFAALCALAPAALGQVTRYALVADLLGDQVSLVDLEQLVEEAVLPTGGQRPQAVVCDRVGRRAFVLHGSTIGGSADVTELDLASRTVTRSLVGPVNLGQEMLVSPSGRWLVVGASENGRVLRYDLADTAAAPQVLDLAPGLADAGRVELALGADERELFVAVAETGSVTRLELETFTWLGAVAAGGFGAAAPEDLAVYSTSGPNAEDVACWVWNDPSMNFTTWDVASGQLTSHALAAAGRGFDLAVDPTTARVAVSGEIVMPSGFFGGALAVWDALGGGHVATISSNGLSNRMRSAHAVAGHFYALKHGSGLFEFDPASQSVSAEYNPTIAPWLDSESRVTEDGARCVFTTRPTDTTTRLVVVDPVAHQLLAEVPLSVTRPTGVALAECLDAVGFDRCSGDGGDQLGCTDCPCGNSAPLGTVGGCIHGAGGSARLASSGSSSVANASGADDLRFALAGAPPHAFCVLESGAALAPQDPSNPCFGASSGEQSVVLDGLRCVTSSTRRHGGRRTDATGSIGATNGPLHDSWGGEGAPSAGLALAFGGFSAGQTGCFQAVFRDDPTAVCQRGLGTSQAIELVFCP